MYYPDKKTFIKLREKGNVIPVFRELMADFETPLSAFIKISKGVYSYLLESVEKGESLGRYSFIGTSPALTIKSEGKNITVTRGKKIKKFKTKKDPIYEIKSIMKKFKFVQSDTLPRFAGGMVGYIGYDMVRFFENIPDSNPDDLKAPDMQFMLSDTLLIFDHVDRKIKIVSNAIIKGDPGKSYDDAVKKIESIVSDLRKGVSSAPVKADQNSGKVESNFSKDDFCGIVEKAKEHIRSGDIIQVVLSQRFKRKTKADSFSIYRALRSINPSPYMYYLDFGDYKIVGSSPEILVRCVDGTVEIRPIAGTRRRGSDKEEDSFLEKELLADPKERAEHIMLVDLGRNDIGRVCDFSSVKIKEEMVVERYSHVMHIVSDIEGRIKKDKDAYDLIRATFPAGTVTGAPKIKAMELIDKFEDIRRGPYAGSVGYFGFSGNMDMCITIRTIIVSGDKVYIQAGAGIVLDSDPVKEYEETINKAKAMMKAVDFAEKELE